MKKFLLKISIFLGGLFLIIFIVFGANRYLSNFRINSKDTTLIIGHSHSECAYNDSLITGVANYSDSGETYFYNYIKLKKLIQQNPHVNKILIEFTNNQIKEYMDGRIWEDKYISHRFPKYGVFMNKEEIELLIQKNPSYFKENLSACFKSNFMMILRNRLNYSSEIGGYKYLERNFTDTEKKEEESLTIEEKTNPNSMATYNLYFLDISKFPLTDDEFGDAIHLNHKGAKKYSLWFDTLLKKGLFQKTNKQQFIDQEIKTLEFEL